jgi:oligopeptide transport system substrate-binding protein
LDVYARDRSAELHRASLAETRFIAFNTTRPALQDARVRRALSFAIDRDAIVTRVLHGGQQPAERFLSPALLGESSPQTGVHHFDPARARALLAEAGYPGGKGFPHLEFSGWDRNPTLEAIQQMWREALGVEVEIVVREAKVHLAALNTGEYDIAFVTNLLDVRDPFSALQDFTTGAPNNFPHWHSPEFDQQLATAGHAIDRASGQRSLLAAERLLLDSAAVAPVYFNAQNWLMSPRVRGWEQDALWSRRYNDVHLELR